MTGKTARLAAAVLGLAAAASLAAQDIRHATGTLNIEIPVRVFKGDAFVDGVTIADFEVYEDGKLQTIDAVYLVKKTLVERKEENTAFVPDTGRHFYLYFELTEYDSGSARPWITSSGRCWPTATSSSS
jgi:hypothetical protein